MIRRFLISTGVLLSFKKYKIFLSFNYWNVINFPTLRELSSLNLSQSSISYQMLTASVWESKVNEIKIGQLAKMFSLMRLEMKKVFLWWHNSSWRNQTTVFNADRWGVYFWINTYQKIKIRLIDLHLAYWCILYADVPLCSE